MSNPAVVETENLGKRYGRGNWGLRDCTFSIPMGRIAALVGPNGSGKSTLLTMTAGITRPTTGTVNVLGLDPVTSSAEVVPRLAYLDQERPLYRSFKVQEMLHYGERLNPHWDGELARHYLETLRIPIDSRVGKLSVGQQAQVALTLCLAKRPEVLLLDEPVAALDPLAREQLLQILMQSVAEEGATVLFSSHAIGDLAAICDYLVLLAGSRVALADDLDYVLASHRLLIGGSDWVALPRGAVLVSTARAARQTHLLVRLEEPVEDRSWQVLEPTLEEIVLAYLRAAEPQLDEAIGGPPPESATTTERSKR
ncbi:MAG TPA: ABC transporter ATP-binding protein [Acidimicrobiales bacterium]|nr:ABC transporter ATP-binding protein [Acidimicrobiales bacterium]